MYINDNTSISMYIFIYEYVCISYGSSFPSCCFFCPFFLTTKKHVICQGPSRHSAAAVLVSGLSGLQLATHAVAAARRGAAQVFGGFGVEIGENDVKIDEMPCEID